MTAVIGPVLVILFGIGLLAVGVWIVAEAVRRQAADRLSAQLAAAVAGHDRAAADLRRARHRRLAAPWAPWNQVR